MSGGGNDKLEAACITVPGSGYTPFASGSWGLAVATALLVGQLIWRLTPLATWLDLTGLRALRRGGPAPS